MTTAVALVGAGPGDPDLLTLRAEHALAQATVVVTDASVAGLAGAFAANARIVVVGAAGTGAATLLEAVGEPGRVVRLYRGDPWLHPAHAAEAAALRAAGIVAEAVPGPSVELATPAVAGIAVTDRRIAAAVTIGPAAVVGPPAHAGHTLRRHLR